MSAENKFDSKPSASNDLETEASSGYGHSGSGYGHSGHGGYGGHGHGGGYKQQQYVYKEQEPCESGLNPLLALGTLALAAGAAYFITLRITMPPTGRRKRSTMASDWFGSSGLIGNLLMAGEHTICSGSSLFFVIRA